MSEPSQILKDFLTFLDNETPEKGTEVDTFLRSPYFYCQFIHDRCPLAVERGQKCDLENKMCEDLTNE